MKPTFIVTRHAYSCNNAANSLADKCADPSITNFGIDSSVGHRVQNNALFGGNNPVVYVSCLVRTWMTAVCLYGSSNKPLTLRVSPWLKEYHFAPWDKGNMPQPLPEQVKLFVIFMQYVPRDLRPNHIKVVLDESDSLLFEYDSGKMTVDPTFRYGEMQYHPDGIQRFYETHKHVLNVRAIAHGTLMKQFPGLSPIDKLFLKTKQNLWSMEIYGETCTVHPGVPYPASNPSADPICKYNTFITRSTFRVVGGRTRRRKTRRLNLLPGPGSFTCSSSARSPLGL